MDFCFSNLGIYKMSHILFQYLESAEDHRLLQSLLSNVCFCLGLSE